MAVGRCDEAVEAIERSIESGYDVTRAIVALTSLPLLAEAHLSARRRTRGDRRSRARYRSVAPAGTRVRGGERTRLSLARAQIAAGDGASAEAGIERVAEQTAALDARDLLPCIEEARAELARSRGDADGCERALRAAARLHRENGEEWLATQAEGRIAP